MNENGIWRMLTLPPTITGFNYLFMSNFIARALHQLHPEDHDKCLMVVSRAQGGIHDPHPPPQICLLVVRDSMTTPLSLFSYKCVMVVRAQGGIYAPPHNSLSLSPYTCVMVVSRTLGKPMPPSLLAPTYTPLTLMVLFSQDQT